MVCQQKLSIGEARLALHSQLVDEAGSLGMLDLLHNELDQRILVVGCYTCDAEEAGAFAGHTAPHGFVVDVDMITGWSSCSSASTEVALRLESAVLLGSNEWAESSMVSSTSKGLRYVLEIARMPYRRAICLSL